ncbi:MAG: hypothetical protein IKZ04_06210 [Spirochaetaceae bacterium]|nr:hypothetical protein [Spirochaetaceae bacterium]
MEITIKEDFSDLTESYLLARKYSGLLAEDNKTYRIWFCIFFIIGLFCLIVSIVRLKTTNNEAIFLVLLLYQTLFLQKK